MKLDQTIYFLKKKMTIWTHPRSRGCEQGQKSARMLVYIAFRLNEYATCPYYEKNGHEPTT